MRVDELKEQVAALPRNEQDAVIAYLFHLRHAEDEDYENEIARRLADREPSRWLSPDEFERALEEKKTR